jgi:transcriptional regulator with XRE-family HTH domain
MTSDQQKEVSLRIKCRRLHLELTLPSAAKLCGIGKGMMSKIEHGHSNVTLDTMMRLSAGLRCTFVINSTTVKIK